MRNRELRKSQRSMLRRRFRLFLYLTDSEAAELERAARESGTGSRGLVIAEAVKTGLTAPRLRLESARKRIGVWIPRWTLAELNRLAHEYDLTRTRLVRYFLAQYLADAHWESPQMNQTAGEAAS